MKQSMILFCVCFVCTKSSEVEDKAIDELLRASHSLLDDFIPLEDLNAGFTDNGVTGKLVGMLGWVKFDPTLINSKDGYFHSVKDSDLQNQCSLDNLTFTAGMKNISFGFNSFTWLYGMLNESAELTYTVPSAIATTLVGAQNCFPPDSPCKHEALPPDVSIELEGHGSLIIPVDLPLWVQKWGSSVVRSLLLDKYLKVVGMTVIDNLQEVFWKVILSENVPTLNALLTEDKQCEQVVRSR